MSIGNVELIRALEEFIEALDRRLPGLEKLGEAAIARDADALRVEAMRRLAELAPGGVNAEPGHVLVTADRGPAPAKR